MAKTKRPRRWEPRIIHPPGTLRAQMTQFFVRLEMGPTAIGDEIGVSGGYIGSVLHGRSRLSIRIARLLEEHFGIDAKAALTRQIQEDVNRFDATGYGRGPAYKDNNVQHSKGEELF